MCWPNACRRSPIKNIPAPKSSSPPTTNSPTLTVLFFICSFLSDQFARRFALALLDLRHGTLGDQLSPVEDQHPVGDAPDAVHVVRDDNQRGFVFGLFPQQQFVD